MPAGKPSGVVGQACTMAGPLDRGPWCRSRSGWYQAVATLPGGMSRGMQCIVMVAWMGSLRGATTSVDGSRRVCPVLKGLQLQAELEAPPYMQPAEAEVPPGGKVALQPYVLGSWAGVMVDPDMWRVGCMY